jgi:hypothetical protein
MRVISEPCPQTVEQCSSCGSAFISDQNNVDANYQRYLEAATETSCMQRFDETITRLEKKCSAM